MDIDCIEQVASQVKKRIPGVSPSDFIFQNSIINNDLRCFLFLLEKYTNHLTTSKIAPGMVVLTRISFLKSPHITRIGCNAYSNSAIIDACAMLQTRVMKNARPAQVRPNPNMMNVNSPEALARLLFIQGIIQYRRAGKRQ